MGDDKSPAGARGLMELRGRVRGRVKDSKRRRKWCLKYLCWISGRRNGRIFRLRGNTRHRGRDICLSRNFSLRGLTFYAILWDFARPWGKLGTVGCGDSLRDVVLFGVYRDEASKRCQYLESMRDSPSATLRVRLRLGGCTYWRNISTQLGRGRIGPAAPNRERSGGRPGDLRMS